MKSHKGEKSGKKGAEGSAGAASGERTFLWILLAVVILLMIFSIWLLLQIFRGPQNESSEKSGGISERVREDSGTEAFPADTQTKTDGEKDTRFAIATPLTAVAKSEPRTWKETSQTVHLPSAALPETQTSAEAAALEPLALVPAANAAYPAKEGEDLLNNQALVSRYMVLIDLDQNTIVAERDSEVSMVPASMTKVLTALVAADYLTEEDLNEEVTVSQEIVDECVRNQATAVGFLGGEKATVRDLFYGMLVTSGADATMALVQYITGSEADFVRLMNQKAVDLGLSSEAHFTNPIGLYDKDLHCTVQDMAKIGAAAMENDLIRQAMEQKYYTTIPYGEEVPEGITVANQFLENTQGVIPGIQEIGAKTGYVTESGSNCVSFVTTDSGKKYVLVTAGSTTKWRCIHDQVSVYRSYVY